MQQTTAGLFVVVAATALATSQSPLTPVVTSAQASVTGTWRSDSVAPVTLVLRTEGAIVTGVVDRCSSTPIVPTEISDGRIDGDTVKFTCTSPDGDRTVSFTGTIAGDEIRFTWKLQVREGGRPPALSEPFGPFPGLRVQPPPRFTARRVSDSVGTAVLNRLAERWRDVPGATSVTFERILRADQESHNWLTYSGNVLGHRHSPLTEITRDNVKDLGVVWKWSQSRSGGRRFQATPLVVDGVLYTVEAPNTVVALDAATGELLWDYRYTPPVDAGASGGGGRVNRGLAVLGDTLFMGTLDAHLLAIDARRGTLRWNRTVADYQDTTCQDPTTGSWCNNITLAPLVVKNMVLVGVGGGDGGSPGFGIRGFIAAFDARTGDEVWRFYTVPAPGEPGNDTWSGDSWKTGGAGVWMTGVYDPQLNLTYWGTGNPSPADGRTRLGDNLYSDSVVALDADTGKLRWHYQFMPHDEVDWDAGQIPVLTDVVWQGQRRQVILWANRNGILYVLDRRDGQFLMGKPFVNVNWLDGFDAKGRPQFDPAKLKQPGSSRPGTNWQSPSFSPRTGWLYVSAQERQQPGPGNGVGAIRALDPTTGERRWEFPRPDAWFFSVLTTGSDLLFSGVWGDPGSGAAGRREDGFFYALDARTGEMLWRTSLGGSVFGGGPVTYSARGRQYVAVTGGDTLFAFALRP